MDFDLSEDQRLLKDSVDRLLGDAYADFERRRAATATPPGYNEALWAQFAALGLLGLPLSEEQGGFGGGPVETGLVMEAIGRTLAPEPFLATVVLGLGLLRQAGSPEQVAEHGADVAAGKLRLAFAHQEPQARYDLHDVATTARQDGHFWVLDGGKGVVLHGDCADMLIVSARTSGGRRDREGIGLFLVDAAASGVQVHGYATQDGQRAAEVSLSGVRAPPDQVLGDPAGALPVIERVTGQAIAALCAEAVGAMEALHGMTVDYLKTRRQFGTAIGSFQALQHRAVDMLVQLEQARSMALFAAMMADDPDPEQRSLAISAAKVQIGDSARFVGQEAIQLHGGIGVTTEYKAGHLFKRLTMIASQFGDADHHLRVLARGGGLLTAE